METAPAKDELLQRIANVQKAVSKIDHLWDAILIVDKLNQYYLTGTMQYGLFIIKSDGTHAYFVRSSYERAKLESPLREIYPMNSYKDVVRIFGKGYKKAYLEMDIVPYAAAERLKSDFGIEEYAGVDKILKWVRAVKSPYELYWLRESGRQQAVLMDSLVPGLLREGMNEAEFMAALYQNMIQLGYQGVTRFSMFQMEQAIGQIGFGENSIYPTCFNGPGGMKGTPSVPSLGGRESRLQKGDLVFVDIGYGVNGYHSDRTQLYLFKGKPSAEMLTLHKRCVEIQRKIAAELKPSHIPSEIYQKTMGSLDKEFSHWFMGRDEVRFLGHGVGLQVDEFPVLAQPFNDPLQENMVLALEPKKAVPGIGLLGAEDTYIVTREGGCLLTGGLGEIIEV